MSSINDNDSLKSSTSSQSQESKSRSHHHHHHHHHRSTSRGNGNGSSNGSNESSTTTTTTTTTTTSDSTDSQNSKSSLGRIGKYQIIKTLGEGSFGKVKLAYHVNTNQKVALKIINRKILAKSDMQGRIEREISYLRLLSHPHIIKLYDVIKSKYEIIMVIEFAGKELFDYIVTNGKMNESEARRFFQQIISAIDYCHRHKIVHRDLKPENLFLDDNLDVKIGDFGLSNIMIDGNFLKTSCGSPNYAAPEVISGKLYAGPEVDVWSCGVILYVMLCGRLPFDDEFIPALFKKISTGHYAIPNFLSNGAKNLLTRMLVVNPLSRITVYEIMNDPWFKIDLPDYLLPVTAQLKQQKEVSNKALAIDDSVVGALRETMGYNKEEVYEALSRTNSNCQENDSQIRDAYQLVQENKIMADELRSKLNNVMNASDYNEDDDSSQNLENPDDGIHSSHHHHYDRHQSVSMDGHHLPMSMQLSQTSNPQPFESKIQTLQTSLPSYHREKMIEMYADSPKLKDIKKISQISIKKSKTRWHFGIRSRSYPLDVMGEIYRALKSLGAVWTKPNDQELWTIHVRWKYTPPVPNSNPNPNPITVPFSTDDNDNDNELNSHPYSSDYMKMQIQLYQIEPNNYLVDFKFDGWESSTSTSIATIPKLIDPNMTEKEKEDEISTFSAYPFLHLATRLIMELAVNSQQQ